MKFLIDAQLPVKLAKFLTSKGFIAIHTLELPNGNKTTDTEIIELSIRDSCIVVTKDSDFGTFTNKKQNLIS